MYQKQIQEHLHLTESGLLQTKDFIQKSNQQIGDIIKSLSQEECMELIEALNTITTILQSCNKAESGSQEE